MGNLSGNILIIKDGGDTFEKYVNKTMIDYGIDVLTWQDIVPLNHSFLEKLILSIKSILKLKKQNNLKTYKKVVVFEHTGIIVLLSLLTNIKRKNLILWIWNTKEKKEIKFVNWIYPFCRIFTFDQQQAKKYNWEYNTQFFLWPNYTASSNNGTAFFVGKNKNRLDLLNEIAKHLIKANIQCDFNILVLNNANKDLIKDEWKISKMISYEEILDKSSKCSVIVDVVKEGQSGLTLRVLEALFFGKKLITNNKNICNCDFYSSDNVFIVGVDNWDDFEMFLGSELLQIPNNVKNKYLLETWVNNFDS